MRQCINWQNRNAMTEKKKKHFLNHPQYPGGPKALTAFIYSQLKYPAAALAANMEGVVWVDYDVDHFGNVIETRVRKGIGYGCDEEACRVVRMLKFDVEKNRGLHVVFHQHARIQFKKPVPAPPPVEAPIAEATLPLQYTIVPTAPASKVPPPAPTVYTYTIS
jgi:TonB family protein